jgi:superoxide dismutase, Fe-Mn family
MKYNLPTLPYAVEALEPHIDAMTMTIHHTKHHQAYIDNLNAALDKHPELYDVTLEKILQNIDSVPSDIRTAVRNHGGGHYNHALFWTLLTPNSTQPGTKLQELITRDFGSLDALKEAFNTAAKTRFGSGWAWLIVTPEKTLKVTSTANQDTPLAEGYPILGLDVWEHAYYLKYQNRRPDYINAFWNIINWETVEERTRAAL